jgi:hypothetical protein
MTRLSDQEKRELLADAASNELQQDFREVAARSTPLAPSEYLAFLTWASNFSKEKLEDRKPMTGRFTL